MFLAFLVATLVLALTPGPGVMYIVTRTLAQGRTAGLASVAGVALGNLASAGLAAAGLAALLAVSAAAYTAVKWAGAAYLVWLGIGMLRQADAIGASAGEAPAAVPRLRLLRDGVLVALLNPKTALFFAAFLPQFVVGADGPGALALGAVFVAVAACTDVAYVLLAAALAPRLAAGRAGWAGLGRSVGGVVLIGLGLATAWSGRSTAR